MINRIKNYLKFLKVVNVRLFFYLNFFCKNIIRVDNSKIIPYKGSVIDISKEAKIYLSGGDFEIGCEKLKKSKSETYIRMRGKSILSLSKGAHLSYGTTIEVLNGGILEAGYFSMNTGSVIIAAKKIILGQDVMIGRNSIIYDSNYHSIVDCDGIEKQKSEEVKIGNHVWLTSNVMVLKGTNIASDSIVSAQTVIKGNLVKSAVYSENRTVKMKEYYGNWNR